MASNRQTEHAPFVPYATPSATPPYIHTNDLPPRIEWNENFGYCGEVAFICAGLYFGQYCSQFTMRSLASPGIPQYSSGSQLLLGINDTTTADTVRLAYEKWPNEGQSSPPQGSTDDFLVWVKKHVALGHPVIIGLFNNEYLLYKNEDPNAGDSEYDHIVVVTQIGSYSTPINDNTYHGTDQIYFNDSGLFGAFNAPQLYFNSSFDAFKLTRQEANAHKGLVYSLYDQPDHYGIAILGVKDVGGITLPVNVKASVNRELPEIVDGTKTNPPPAGSNSPPTPSPLTLSITVSNLTPNTSYNLYIYDDFTKVPTQNFNANAADAKQKIVISSTTTVYTASFNIMSNETMVFRAVPLGAP